MTNNLTTRITEAEERALEALRDLLRCSETLSESESGAVNEALVQAEDGLVSAQRAVVTAAALARDFARREG